MAAETPDYSESLEFLLYLRDDAETRAKQLVLDIKAISEDGALFDYDLTRLEQLHFANMGIYNITNELRLYDKLIAYEERKREGFPPL